jgi:DNA helicase-2/ATP-dependent DNA helicase PcrA
VALTRAQDHLHVYAPLRYHHGGPIGRRDTHSYAQRSRFLPPAVDPLLDHRAVRAPLVDASGPSATPRSSADSTADLSARVDQALRALW